MDILDRISDILVKQGKKQKELTAFLGVKESAYSEWRKGKSLSYKSKYINRIAEYLNVSPEYLLGHSDDVGTFAAGDVNAAELLNIYNKLSAVDRAKLLVYADSLLSGK